MSLLHAPLIHFQSSFIAAGIKRCIYQKPRIDSFRAFSHQTLIPFFRAHFSRGTLLFGQIMAYCRLEIATWAIAGVPVIIEGATCRGVYPV
jgi:hypothetical protein